MRLAVHKSDLRIMLAVRTMPRQPLLLSRTAFILLLLLMLPPTVCLAQVNWDAWRARPTEPVAYPDLLIEPDDLEQRLAEPTLTIVDGRSLGRYNLERLPGSRHIDARALRPEPDSLGVWFARAGISDTAEVVVYGDAADPAASGRLLWLLELAGHRHARVLQGGLEAWRRMGHAVERWPATMATLAPLTAPASTPAKIATFTTPPDTSRLATTPWLLGAFGDREQNVLDWRQPAAWSTGHIPHSLPFDLTMLVDEHGAMNSGPKTRAILADWGPRTGEHVKLDLGLVVLGDDPPGALAVHPYLAGRLAGIEGVRVYPGGFTEWEASVGPVVRIIATEAVRDTLRSRWPRGRVRNEPPPQLILLDLRGQRDFQLGHLPGAVLLPSHSFEANFLRVVAEHWPRADPATIPVVVYCYGPTCTRSRNGCTIAARFGFHRLYWYMDGIEGWRKGGQKLAKPR